MRSMIASTVLLLLLACPRPASADGMVFRNVVTGGGIEVQATAQRAVMWHRSGVWEVHIQPVFSREAGSAAWVVPFPVRPQIHEGKADFFDQLELATSPVFLQYCYEDSGGGAGCGMGMAATDGGRGGESNQGGETSVTVWEQGEVGELEYSILSTAGGDDLAAWLAAEGYEMPAGTDAILSAFETEGMFFFVAGLGAGVDPDKPLAPVRFVLPGMDPAVYPLRLTGLGAPPGEHLDLTLWIICNREYGFIPESHPYNRLRYSGPRTAEEYQAAIDAFFESHSADTMVLRTSMDYELYDLIHTNRFCSHYMTCASFSSLGISNPSWTSEMNEILSSGDTIFRYQARFTANAMSVDLTLREATYSEIPYESSIFEESLGSCDGSGGSGDGGVYTFSVCSVTGRPSRGWLAAAVLVLAVAAGLWLASRRTP